MLYQPVIIRDIRQVVSGFSIFTFEEGHDIPYAAGQYLTFVHDTGYEELRRSYSILSAPLLHEPLAIGVRRIDNGAFSRWLSDSAAPGSRLLTTGAAGFFTLPDNIDAYRQVFFMAAGSGITPIYSLLKALLHGHPGVQAVLVYSNPSPAHTILYEELQALARTFGDRFQIRFIFSNDPQLARAHLNREYLVQLLGEYLTASPQEALFYTCGPEAYMRMCTYTLHEEGVPPQQIRREHFFTEKRIVTHPPIDETPRHVLIRYDGVEHVFTVNYPDTILQAAKKAGIRLPYSCEAGRCGSCAARCISGRVWLSYNEVLTETELRQGLTLTCVGHPAGGDVVLSLDALP